ncbi:hypothetical protein SAMN05216236_13518 [Sedimentitalea nanhaiensis]|uniref:Uncharacterized protein n=1 Tax=Sedimentitalea nanhaiensis TaxID=999627 RepID=A0A1I7DUR1_9RHOB|nr:hypothetical protein SAMN05216236_13518 [Sedimentitalea nanhaiensis]
MVNATIRSGHAVPVQATQAAAKITAALPIASLREKSQTARTFASPARCGSYVNKQRNQREGPHKLGFNRLLIEDAPEGAAHYAQSEQA